MAFLASFGSPLPYPVLVDAPSVLLSTILHAVSLTTCFVEQKLRMKSAASEALLKRSPLIC